LKVEKKLGRKLGCSWLEASGSRSCDVVVDGGKVSYRGECRGILYLLSTLILS
jgi:hypothetical protein